jgi:predicted RNase H-like nuclease (RuvC/YqgF family)
MNDTTIDSTTTTTVPNAEEMEMRGMEMDGMNSTITIGSTMKKYEALNETLLREIKEKDNEIQRLKERVRQLETKQYDHIDTTHKQIDEEVRRVMQIEITPSTKNNTITERHSR